MTSRILSLVLSIIFCQTLHAQVLKYSTRKPTWGEEITFQVNSELAFRDPDHVALYLEVYLEDGGNYDQPLEMVLVDDLYSVTWIVPEGVSNFLPIIYFDGVPYDLYLEQKRSFSDVQVYRSPGIAAKNSTRYSILQNGNVKAELKQDPENLIPYFYRWWGFEQTMYLFPENENRLLQKIAEEWEALEQGAVRNQTYYVAQVAAWHYQRQYDQALAALYELIEKYPDTEWFDELLHEMVGEWHLTSFYHISEVLPYTRPLADVMWKYITYNPQGMESLAIFHTLMQEHRFSNIPEIGYEIAQLTQNPGGTGEYLKYLYLSYGTSDSLRAIEYLAESAQLSFNQTIIEAGPGGHEFWETLAPRWSLVAEGYLAAGLPNKARYLLGELQDNLINTAVSEVYRAWAYLYEYEQDYQQALNSWFEAAIRGDQKAMTAGEVVYDTYLRTGASFSEVKTAYVLPYLQPETPKRLVDFKAKTVHRKTISKRSIRDKVVVFAFLSDQSTTSSSDVGTLNAILAKYEDQGVAVVAFFECEKHEVPELLPEYPVNVPLVAPGYFMFDSYEIPYDQYDKDTRTDFQPRYLVFDSNGEYRYGFEQSNFMKTADLTALIDRIIREQ